MLGLVTSVVIVLAVGLVWRLNAGPISLEFARKFIAESLQAADLPADIAFGEPVATWRGLRGLLDVTVEDIRLTSHDKTVQASAPNIHFRLSIQALLEGVAAPVRITVDRPAITLSGMAASEPPDGDSDLLAELTEGRRHDHPLARLERIELRDAQISLAEPVVAGLSTITMLDATLSKQPDGLRAEIDAIPLLDGHPTPFSADIAYAVTDNAIKGVVSADDLSFSWLTGLLPSISGLPALSSPVNGSVTFELEPPDRVLTAAMSLHSVDGTVTGPDIIRSGLPYDSLTLEAAYDGKAAALDVTNLELRHDGARASATLEARNIFDRAALSVHAEAESIAVDAFERYWPQDLAGSARDWIVTNLADGRVSRATLHLQGALETGDSPALDIASLGGDIDFEGVTAHYFRPLPPVTDVAGRAEFDAKAFNIAINAGRLADLQVKDATVTLSGLDTGREIADIAVETHGPVRTALNILAHDALNLRDRMPFEPEAVSGRGATTLRFSLPLLNDLALDEVQFGASATLTDLAVRSLAFGWPLSDGRFTLDLDPDSMEISGAGLLAGRPITLETKDIFARTAEVQQHTRLATQLDPTQLRAMGLPDSVIVDGLLDIEADLQQKAAGVSTISASIDLENADVAITPLQWEKPKGASGRISLDLDLRDDRPLNLRSATVRAAGLTVDAAAEFDPGGGSLERVTLEQLKLDDIDVAGSIMVARDGSYTADLLGPRFDVRRFIPTGPAPDAAPAPPLTLHGAFDELAIQGLPTIDRAVMNVIHDGSRVQETRISGRVRNDPIILTYSMDADNVGHFEIQSDNAGTFLQELDAIDSVVDGELRAAGSITGFGAEAVTRLNVRIKQFGVVDAPVVVRLFSAAILPAPALLDALRGKEGMRFTRLETTLGLTEDRVDIHDFLAEGVSIGVAAEGSIDRASEHANISGTLIPAFELNRLIKQIPLVGRLLTGDKDEGLLGTAFHVSGPMSDPSTVVNPLTAVTPGFLTKFIKKEMAKGSRSPNAPTDEPGDDR